MRGLRQALFDKAMTRKEFLQFVGSSLIILFGLSNFIQLIQKTVKPEGAATAARHGFGSRKFGE